MIGAHGKAMTKLTDKVTVLNVDCMTYLATCKDKAFELAIVDVPYGGGQHFNFRFGTGDLVYDSRKPEAAYFTELFRVSQNQICWGGNYLTDMLPVSRCWISWYKGNPIDAFSDFELAWTSFDRTCKAVKIESYGFNHADARNGESTIHPTQKPVALYRWLLTHYAKPGDRILDTHFGSLSSGIACHVEGFEYVGTELDPDYFAAAIRRFKEVTAQKRLFA